MEIKARLLFLILILPAFIWASSEHVELDEVHIDLHDKASLQRGARLFVNYCAGCHAASYMRYERMAEDLDIPKELAAVNLMFTTDKIGDPIKSAMPKEDAKRWFGTLPPDLSLAARLRGEDWLYTYLRSFYIDASRPWGVNNKVFKDVGMPNVLAELQGEQREVCRDVPMLAENGGIKRDPLTRAAITEEQCGFLEVVPDTGKLSPDEFDAAVTDLVNFMTYMAEPVRVERQRMGIFVLLFLGILLVFAYLLKREYWKDVH